MFAFHTICSCRRLGLKQIVPRRPYRHFGFHREANQHVDPIHRTRLFLYEMAWSMVRYRRWIWTAQLIQGAIQSPDLMKNFMFHVVVSSALFILIDRCYFEMASFHY